jgi:thioredoxin 1
MLLSRRTVLALPLAPALLASLPARAVTLQNFTQAAFQSAQQAGKPILVYVEASWCPTCAKQRPILGRLEKDPAFANLTVFSVDFDTQKDVVREFGVRMQSTLIAFHGSKETARSTGQTDPDKIRALLTTAEA